MTEANILRKAKKLIETKGWCQGPLARDQFDNPVASYSKKAVSFCAIGAISRIANFNLGSARFLAKAIRVRGAHKIGAWNDRRGRTKSAVLSAFDRAIALAEKSDV